MSRACEEIVDFIAAGATREIVMQFEPSAGTKARVEHLLHQEKTDGLLPEEAAELNDYLQLEHLLRLAKARARTFGAS